MADEFDLDQLDADINNKNKVEERIRGLNEKVKLTQKERDERDTLLKQKDDELISAKKEVEFYSKFSDSTAKYSGAHEFKDKIREKVMQGYDVEDATVAVLAREGKLATPAAQQAERDTVAGGSATTAMKGDANKQLHEMSREEKRSALMEGDSKGDLERILRTGN
jgi:hypothetical protein